MIQSVVRAIEILEAIHRQKDGEAGLVDIAKSLGLDKSTVHNLAKTLKAKNFIEQDGQGGKYKLGRKLLELARGNLNVDMLAEKLAPFCMEIKEKTNESVSVVTYASAELRIICRILSEKAVNVAPNSFKPLYSTASGRCLLAQLPESELDEAINIYGFPEDAWDGITSRAKLKKELEEIRKKKIITAISEEREIAAIGSIIEAPARYAPLAIGVFLPLYRFSSDHKNALLKITEEYANKTSNYVKKLS